MSLNNSQYQSIMRKYNETQLKNRHIQDMRKEEVYSEIPRMKAIDREVADISIKQARKLIEGNADAITTLKQQLDALSKEKKNCFQITIFPKIT